MKKLIFASIFIPLISFISIDANAQSELSSSQIQSSGLYFRPSTSKLSPHGTKNLATRFDSLQKAIGLFKASSPLTRIYMPTHDRSSFGTTVLVSGVKTVTSPIVTASSKIVVFLITPSGTIGHNYYVSTVTAGTSFVIKSVQQNSTDQTGDNSTVGYLIVN